jgi:NAD-dependent SIR2 family protein deacetylase
MTDVMPPPIAAHALQGDKNELRPTHTEEVVTSILGTSTTTTGASNSSEAVLPAPDHSTRSLAASHAKQHGLLGDPRWAPPEMVAFANIDARPGYDSCKAHEYMDTPRVLAAKVRVFADLVRRSRHCIAYTGAGISTASGISDYASRAATSVSGVHKPPPSPMDAQPTLAHRTLTSMYRSDYLKWWIQQNHDGLPQKAGYPQHALNEIHGAWYDPSNPVVRMSGALRDDLFADLLEWEQNADLCLALGTSLAGMNADRVVTTVAQRAAAAGTTASGAPALGAVVVSLQQTPLDARSSLRIFGRIDDVMQLLATELGLRPAVAPSFVGTAATTEGSTPSPSITSEQYWIRYGSDGQLLPLEEERDGEDKEVGGAPSPSAAAAAGAGAAGLRLLDLGEGAVVRITAGPYAGDEGEVLGRSRHGHYQMRFMHLIHKRQGEGGGGSGGGGCWRAPMTHTLGAWWVAEALAGQLAHFPLETVQTAAEAAAAAQQAAAGPQACSKAALRPEAAVSSGSGALPEWVRLSYLQESRRQQEQPSATAVCAEQ